jgi:hypothetical protein
MRFRTLALAFALVFGCGAVSSVHAADTAEKVAKRNRKRSKQWNKQRAKQAKASKVKPRKATKIKRA